MLKDHPLINDFKQGMRSNDQTRFHIDDWPYIVTWPFVYMLKGTPVTPNQICLLSFFSGIAFFVALLLGYSQTNHYLLSSFLGLRILLDCADGQLARYANKTSNLGALYDLTADFVFVLLLFTALAYHFIFQKGATPLLVIPICFFALISFLVTATVHSYSVRLEESSEPSILAVKDRFCTCLPNDLPENVAYTKKLIFFNKLFFLSWRPVTLFVTSVFGNNTARDNRMLLFHPLSITEYSMHLTVLFVIVLTRSPLYYFLIFESIPFCVAVIFLIQSHMSVESR